MKIWAPGISLRLVESNHRKAAFLREGVRALTLTNVDVITVRAETLPPVVDSPGYDLSATPTSRPDRTTDIVTLRAVERFETVLPIAARLVHPRGRLALLIGSSQLHNLATLSDRFQALPPIPVPMSMSRVVQILVRQ